MIPSRVVLSDQERTAEKLSERTLLDSVNSIKRNGFAIIDNIFSPEYIDLLRKAYEEQLNAQKKSNTTSTTSADRYELVLDHKRTMHQLEISGEFINPYLYNNYAIGTICRTLMPEQLVLSSFGAVTSYPGANTGSLHTDAPRLFPENADMSNMIPTYAITATIPLVELNESVGGTVLINGSNIVDASQEESFSKYQISEYPQLGGCLLWDFRTFHGGAANQSTVVRPLLYIVYCREWYRDPINNMVSPLNIHEKDLQKIPKEDKALFNLAKNPHREAATEQLPKG